MRLNWMNTFMLPPKSRWWRQMRSP